MRKEGTRFSRWWGAIMGIGLALSPVHNVWLTNLATNSKGETLFFLPTFGYLIIFLVMILFLPHRWKQIRETGLGDKRVWIPLLVIVGAIGLSGIAAEGAQAKLAPLGMGVALFGLYLMARIIGKDLFLPLAVGAGIASLGVIIQGAVQPGIPTGGLVFEKNYDIVVGYTLLGTALFIHRYQWLLASLALVAMFLSGGPEAVFALGVLLLAVLLRRDWGRKLVFTVISVIIVASVGFSIGWGQNLYHLTAGVLATSIPTQHASRISDVLPTDNSTPYLTDTGARVSPVGERIQRISTAMADIKPLGEGYIVTDFSKIEGGNVHNVPLVIIQQLGWAGIPAGLAWLWISVWCLIKTKWKYAWILVLALAVSDHYTWTQIGHWWWAIVGVSTASSLRSDLIFRSIQGIRRDSTKRRTEKL